MATFVVKFTAKDQRLAGSGLRIGLGGLGSGFSAGPARQSEDIFQVGKISTFHSSPA